jgi:hypothetical protein
MAQQVDYVISTRRVAGGQFTAEPGPTRFLQVARSAGLPQPSMEIRPASRVAEDRSDAAAVAVKLVAAGVTLLAKAQDAGCQTNLHLIGHSTGANVVLEAFAEAQQIKQLYRSEWRVAQPAFKHQKDWNLEHGPRVAVGRGRKG